MRLVEMKTETEGVMRVNSAMIGATYTPDGAGRLTGG